MTAGFLMAVVTIALTIIMAAPEYAKPAAGALFVPAESAEPSPDPSAGPLVEAAIVPTSATPDRLKGYRWPVKGGMVAKYYEPDREGRYVVGGQRIHAGLLITWFEGAVVKAAHKGTVVAAGRDWAGHIGYDGELDEVYSWLERRKRKPSLGVVIDDGNGYLSVYSELKDLRVKRGQKVKAGQVIGGMSRAEGRQMMRYQLVRADGQMMKVHPDERMLGYPDYAHELVDPLAVLKLEAKRKPSTTKRTPPPDPPRLSEY